jgi:DNA polymerase I
VVTPPARPPDPKQSAAAGIITAMQVAVVPSGEAGGLVQPLAADGAPIGRPEPVADLTAAIAAREAVGRPRWVWSSTAGTYPGLLAAGARVDRCHDLELTEALLLGYAGSWGEPRGLPAAWARLRGEPVSADVPPRRDVQPALFEPEVPGLAEATDRLAAVVGVYTDQLRRIAAVGEPSALAPPVSPAAFRLLVAAESAAALAAVEMTAAGVPWRADRHDEILTEILGPRPPAGALPARMRTLADAITAAFDGWKLNPDSPADVIKAFAAVGVTLTSTRSYLLREVDHPAAPLLLEYKELSRLHSANGWSWLSTWVADGRFRPEYVPGGVVSGRWASRGGGALQIPHAVRAAVIADPGWTLVVADAAQLEPRILAALSGDRGLAQAAAGGDLYTTVAASAFAGDRGKAKIALLSAMYGGTAGGAAAMVATLRSRFPRAIGYVEDAARTGEQGGVVRSRLGRTCPLPSERWQALLVGTIGEPAVDEAGSKRAGQVARDRGRFTRNFVVQASAADWANVLIAALRRRLAGTVAQLVFFQHDEVVVHCPAGDADEVTAAVTGAAAEATNLVFPGTSVRFPLPAATAECYADAKH